MYYKLASDESDITLTHNDIAPSTTLQNFISTILSPYAHLFTIFLLVLQSVFILSLPATPSTPSAQDCSAPSTPQCPDLANHVEQGFIRAQFGREFAYMTLDPRYDYLWNETAASSMIISSQGVESGKEEVGSISM